MLACTKAGPSFNYRSGTIFLSLFLKPLGLRFFIKQYQLHIFSALPGVKCKAQVALFLAVFADIKSSEASSYGVASKRARET